MFVRLVCVLVTILAVIVSVALWFACSVILLYVSIVLIPLEIAKVAGTEREPVIYSKP